MGRIAIALSQMNGNSYLAVLEDDGIDSIDLVKDKSKKTACLMAAKKLRDLAARFELLAAEKEPTNCDVHNRINRMKLPAEQRSQPALSAPVKTKAAPKAKTPSKASNSKSKSKASINPVELTHIECRDDGRWYIAYPDGSKFETDGSSYASKGAATRARNHYLAY